MKQLRERGIYQTPNGQRLVASRRRGKSHIAFTMEDSLGCFLYSVYHWAFHGNPDFKVAAHGALLPINQSETWSIEELIDTGVTAGTH